MKKLKTWKGYNWLDAVLLGTGLITIITTSIIFKSTWLVIINSILGLCCVFMQAKGKIATQFIGIIWFVFYCFLAYQQKYYGETILYATIMIPLYIYGVIHWLAYRDKQDNVVIIKSKIKMSELAIFSSIWLAVSIGVFFLLRSLNTSQLWLSTIAFCTMLPSVYLLIRRNKWNQLMFLINDIVLCILWQTLVYKGDLSFVPILCYQVFQIIYDAYGMLEWFKLEKRQRQTPPPQTKMATNRLYRRFFYTKFEFGSASVSH